MKQSDATIFFLAYAAHDLCILDEGDIRYSQIYTEAVRTLRDADLTDDQREHLTEWLDSDDPWLLTDYLETLMNTYNVGGWCD